MASSRPIVCLVTDRHRFMDEDRMVRLVAAAAAAGIDLVQIRERTLDDRRLFALTRRIVTSVAGTRTRVVVNERCDVALAAGAAGVHLRADSVVAARVRQIAPSGFLIGRSVHSVGEALRAGDGVDYLVMGTVFATASKSQGTTPAGTGVLAQVCRAVDVPVLAIGGVTADKAGDLAAAGAAGFAAIGLFSDASHAHSDSDLATVLSDLMAAVRRAFTTPSR